MTARRQRALQRRVELTRLLARVVAAGQEADEAQANLDVNNGAVLLVLASYIQDARRTAISACDTPTAVMVKFLPGCGGSGLSSIDSTSTT